MINIPIWLFVILITLSALFVIGFIMAIISFLQVCKIDEHDKNIHPGKND